MWYSSSNYISNKKEIKIGGPVFFYTNSPPGEQFFFLKNMIGVFADEIDTAGNDVTRVWELK